MKRLIALLLAVMMLICFVACVGSSEDESQSASETTAPETTAPETTAPETTAPETTAPETNGPETTGDEDWTYPVA